MSKLQHEKKDDNSKKTSGTMANQKRNSEQDVEASSGDGSGDGRSTFHNFAYSDNGASESGKEEGESDLIS